MTFVPYLYDETVSVELGAWNRATGEISMKVTAQAYGSIYVHLSMIDPATDEAIAESGFPVYVVGGTLDISETEFMLAPGESKTLTISGTPFDAGEKVYLAADEFSSNYLDWPRGRMISNPAQFTVKGLAEGYDVIFITLAEEVVHVYVNSDGRGAE